MEVYLFIDDYHGIAENIHEADVAVHCQCALPVHAAVHANRSPASHGQAASPFICFEIDASTLRFNFDETRRFVEHECPGKLGTTDAEVPCSQPPKVLGRRCGSPCPCWWWTIALKAGGPARRPAHQGRWQTTPKMDITSPLPAVGMFEFMLRTAILDRLECAALRGAHRREAEPDHAGRDCGALLLLALTRKEDDPAITRSWPSTSGVG